MNQLEDGDCRSAEAEELVWGRAGQRVSNECISL